MDRGWRFGLVLLVAWLWGWALAQEFSGTFTTQGQNGAVVLNLKQSGTKVQGSLSGNGAQFSLEGQLQGDEVLGVLRDNQGALYVLLYFEGSQLMMTLAEIDPSSRDPVPGSERELVFSRSQSSTNPNPPPNPSAAGPDFSGRYSTQGMALELKRNGVNYSGSISLQGKTYPISGSVSANKLNGGFKVGSTNYIYVATLNANKLSLQYGGKTYILTKTTAATNSQPNPKPQAPVAAAQPQPTGASSYQTEMRAGGQYSANARIGSKIHGVALTVPAGFKGQTNGSLTVLGDGQGTGVLVIPLLGVQMNELVSLLASPIQLTDQTALEPQGSPLVQGSRASVRYAGEANGLQIVGLGMALVSNGRAVVFQAITDAAQSAQLERTAQALLASIGFLSAQGSTQLNQAAAVLTSKQIGTFSYSQVSGASSQSTLELCGNGSYAYQGESERPWQAAYRSSGGSFTLNSAGGDIMGMVPGSQSSNQHQGQWRMVLLGSDLLLVLRSQEGQVYVRSVTNLSARFPFLDGKEVGSFGSSQRCR